MRQEEERDSLLAAAGAGAPTSTAFSVRGFFSHCKAEVDFYLFDVHAVCRRGDYAALKRFVNAHPDPELLRRMANRLDIIGRSPLYEVVMHSRSLGHSACAQLLLQLGADPNFSDKDDPFGALLNRTITYSRLEMAALLIQNKAKFKTDSKGNNLGLESPRDKEIAEARKLAEKKPPLDFIAKIEAIMATETEEDTAHTESKKER